MRTVLVAAATAALTTIAVTGLTSGASAAPTKAAGAQEKVIVLLGQHQALRAMSTDLGRRRAAVSSDQAPVRAQIGRLGGRTTRSYAVVNAVAATVPAGGIAALRSNPAVTAVVPDLPVSMPARTRLEAATTTAKAAAPTPRYCPTDPAKPQLEPEALELTHTDTDHGTDPTARSLGYTGRGVKVGFIADGTDIDQPDLIRADGSHVVTDYQDFSGDGTTSSTSGAEAMGDVSSIAAQGRASYDLAAYVNPSHPLPAGCNIRIEGMAPGASVVALKVFSNNLLTAPTSTIVQAIDYAVSVGHVDVLNESFGANPYPDDATDPISIANQDAIDAGVAVTASTGDSGSGNTLGTGSTDPNVIAVGASTSERLYAQLDNYGFPLSNGRYTSDQVSGLSSGGISQTNRVQDLLAPGDLGWSLCSDRRLPNGDPQYVGCTDYNTGAPSKIQDFGGTSQSAPLTAGAAALVIQAYRSGHGGATPAPSLVRRILTSSADDLGLPAEQQGAGLLNSYRAVRLAHDYRLAHPSGQELSAGVPQLSNVSAPGRHVTDTVTLTNQGTGPQRVTAALRQVSHVSGQQVQSVAFDPAKAPTFLDALGRPRPYALKTFSVPVGTDRLDAAVTVAGDGTKIVRATLLDPQGTFTAYTLPQGAGNFGHIGVHQPAPGTWTAIVWSSGPDPAASVSGPIALRTTYYTATSAGTVSPRTATIPQGGAQTFRVTTNVPANEATASSLVLTHRFGATTTVPIVNRAVQRVGFGRPAAFAGRFDQANGRDFSPAQSFTYLVDVPAGARDLAVDVAITGVPSNQIIAHLSDPTGEPVSTGRNDLPGTGTTPGQSYSGLQLVHARPLPGRYQLTLELQNSSSGAALPQRFTGAFRLNAATVSAALPANATVSRSSGTTADVRITNTSPTPQTYFVDGRTYSRTTYPLVAGNVEGDAPSTSDPFSRKVALPLASDDVVPAWLVPTQVSTLTVGASATDPVTFDLMPLDGPTTLNAPNNPDTEAVTSGRSATAVHSAPEVGSTQWAAFPSPLGPVAAGGQPAGSVTMSATARARTFDKDVTTTSGDPLLGTVDVHAPTAHPVTIAPGGHATITVSFTPHGAVGSTHSGTLFVDIAQPFGPKGASTLTEEVRAFPYSYTVGAPATGQPTEPPVVATPPHDSSSAGADR
ncbi:MAG TPA: S8 family serine peptidase [Friedmanniella sp.]